MGRQERIESVMATVAAASFAGAVGFAMWNLVRIGHGADISAASASAGAVLAFAVSSIFLFRVEVEARRAGRFTYDLRPHGHSVGRHIGDMLREGGDFPQPVATAVKPAAASPAPSAERRVELVAVASGPAMAGQSVQSDCHGGGGLRQSQPADASQDLHDALHQLRRSLR